MPFYLKSDQRADGTRHIYLRFHYHNHQLKLYTGLSLHAEDWDDGKQRPKRGFKYYSQYVKALDQIETALYDNYYSVYLSGIPKPEELKRMIWETLRPAAPETVYSYAEKFVKDRAKTHSKASVSLYKRTLDLLGQFDRKALFNDIDVDWLDKFKAWLLKQGFEQNTAAKHFSTLRTILNDATDRGVNVSVKYKTRKVSVGRVTTTKVFLDEAELRTLYKAPMPNEQKELARDLFIIASYTGVRYQDIWKINRDSFVQLGGRPHFRFTAQKTRDEQLIPAHPYVVEIMQRRGWKLAKLSNQKYNIHLKEICKLAGIDRDVVVTSYPGGKRVDKKLPKHELVSSHTARRNLVCNMLIAGVPTETIKKISGHKTQSAFDAYVRLTPSDHLKIAFRSSFFAAAKVR